MSQISDLPALKVSYTLMLPSSQNLPPASGTLSFPLGATNTTDAKSHLESLSKSIEDCSTKMNEILTEVKDALGPGGERDREIKAGVRGDRGKGVNQPTAGGGDMDSESETSEEEESL